MQQNELPLCAYLCLFGGVLRLLSSLASGQVIRETDFAEMFELQDISLSLSPSDIKYNASIVLTGTERTREFRLERVCSLKYYCYHVFLAFMLRN